MVIVCVISVAFLSAWPTVQYFSSDSFTACSTLSRDKPAPPHGVLDVDAVVARRQAFLLLGRHADVEPGHVLAHLHEDLDDVDPGAPGEPDERKLRRPEPVAVAARRPCSRRARCADPRCPTRRTGALRPTRPSLRACDPPYHQTGTR